MTSLGIATLLLLAVSVFPSESITRDQCSPTRYCKDGTKCCADKLHCCPDGYKCCAHFTKCCRGLDDEAKNSTESFIRSENEVKFSSLAIHEDGEDMPVVEEESVDRRLSEIVQRLFKTRDNDQRESPNRKLDGKPVIVIYNN